MFKFKVILSCCKSVLEDRLFNFNITTAVCLGMRKVFHIITNQTLHSYLTILLLRTLLCAVVLNSIRTTEKLGSSLRLCVGVSFPFE